MRYCPKFIKGTVVELKTSRLYIRDLREDDWSMMKNLFIDFNNSKYSVYDRPLPTEDMAVKALTKEFIENSLFFAIFLLDKSQMIGYVCFHKDEEKYDLGYCFHSAFHSNGYAYESIKELIDHFAKENNVTMFTAGTAIANTPSCKLLKKLGFKCVSTEYLSFNGDFSFEGGNFILNLQ